MKKIFLLFILFLIGRQSFSQDTLFFDKNWKPAKRNAAVFYRIQKKADSIWVRTDYYRSNDQVQMVGHLCSVNPPLEQDEFKWYWQNGQLKHIGRFDKGKETGLHKWYSAEGKQESSENYKDGKLYGEMISYYPNGEKSMVTNFNDDIQDGLTTFYYENGNKKARGLFKDGEESGTWEYWDITGALLDKTEFKTNYDFIKEGFHIKLPNTYWSINVIDSSKSPVQYIYKRIPIKNSKGISVIPAIMVFTEDATAYNGDVVSYSILKEKTFQDNSDLKIELYFTSMNKNWPLRVKNSVGCRAVYTEKGEIHIFYMIYIINRNKGIQVYMDLPMEQAKDYEAEFIQCIGSLSVEE